MQSDVAFSRGESDELVHFQFFLLALSLFPFFRSFPLLHPFQGIMLGPLRAALRGAGARSAAASPASAARRGFAAGESFFFLERRKHSVEGGPTTTTTEPSR